MSSLSLRQLKWISIIIPAVAVGAFEHVRHTYLAEYLHGPIGNFVTMGIDLVGIFIFFQAIFGIVERMQNKMVRRNQELSIINSVVAGAGQSMELDQVLDLGLSAALQALERQQGAGWIYEERARELLLRAHRGVAADGVQDLARLSGEPAFLAALPGGDVPQTVEVPPSDKTAGRAARLVMLPLRAKGRLLGAIAVVDDAQSPASLDRELLASIAGHVSMAVDNAKLFQEAVKRQHQAQALHQLGMEVSTLLDLDRVLASVVEKAQELLGVDLVALALWDDQAQDMSIRASLGFRTDPARQTRQARWLDLNRRILSTGQPVQEVYYEEDQDSIVRVEGDIAHLAVPLKVGKKVIGVLHGAYRRHHVFPQEDIELFASLANQAAIAVENTGLYAQVQNLAVLEERDRLAREMHDSLAQVLGFLSLKAAAAQDLLASKHLVQARHELRQIEKAAEESYVDVREAILGLRTSVVPGGGLSRTLKEYLQKFSSQSGIKAELVAAQEKSPVLPPAAEVQLIRIIQEALTNVRKHAQARRVWVRMEHAENQAQIRIEDDGQGFELLQVQQQEGRYGLHTMKERAEGVGGALTIETSPGQGTRVIISLPLRQAGSQVSRREGRSEPAADSISGRPRTV
ncbi:MAG TPA: GAF domain-containing protein [Dehalococcoidia bacterium]|nr:GAF domain-containing protein [Dehalococcoidia bacterium]